MSDREESYYKNKRNDMVYNQIVPRAINDVKLINALLKIPRHKFVPERKRKYSYSDTPLPIGFNQTISQPFIVALMTQLLSFKEGQKVLEIGTGSGYQTAILSEMGCEVYSIEIVEYLSKKAEKLLKSLGYENIHFKIEDGYSGWKEYSPFDAVIVTAASKKIPNKLVEQLKIGGRMVVPVGDEDQQLILIKKTESEVETKYISPVRFVPMKGEEN